MSDVLIRNLDENVVIRLKERARDVGQSVNTFLRIVLTNEAMRAPRHEVAVELERLRATSTRDTHASSTDILRKLRDGTDQRI